MIIHILLVHTLQLQSPSVLICLANITLNEKSVLYTSQYAVGSPMLYCSRIRKNVTDRETEKQSEKQRENSVTEATLITMDFQVEWANIHHGKIL